MPPSGGRPGSNGCSGTLLIDWRLGPYSPRFGEIDAQRSSKHGGTPSPRVCGERVGVRGKFSLRKPAFHREIHAPHPTPLPVKNGEREQTESVAALISSDRNVRKSPRSPRTSTGRKSMTE